MIKSEINIYIGRRLIQMSSCQIGFTQSICMNEVTRLDNVKFILHIKHNSLSFFQV